MLEPLFTLDSDSPAVERHSPEKRHGIHYTPRELARFVARRSLAQIEPRELVILDPACGDGELLMALAHEASAAGLPAPHLVGIDRDENAVAVATERLEGARTASCLVSCRDFLARRIDGGSSDFAAYDVVISNPPYVRTQVLGAARARALGRQFGLTGRVDLYHAFVAAMTANLAEGGVLGLVCSNRFMTTKGGLSLRTLLFARYDIAELWDLGDSKLFEAAVLPAVVIARRGSQPKSPPSSFVRIYEDKASLSDPSLTDSLLGALEGGVEGPVAVDGRVFAIERGELALPSPNQPWRLASLSSSRWLGTVKKHAAGRFGDIGPIRVGIKTTADSVFIRSGWSDLPEDARPESALLHPLLTHRLAARWRASDNVDGARSVLYPHEIRDGRRQVVDLARFPRAAAYLEPHRSRLEGRDYVRKAGRAWYEIWVPQQPDAWGAAKLVWPDISERPKFFLDRSEAIVNGDCYWLSCGHRSDDEIALALAVANSSFAVQYYDTCYGNRLYAGRRRFITQYLEELPLPELTGAELRDVREMVDKLRQLDAADPESATLELVLDQAVSELFGLEEVGR
jgi:adenine-specific DNA-methyltransferase